MKIIDTDQQVHIDQLLSFLRENVNKRFEERRQISLTFDIDKIDDTALKIYKPEIYDDFIFRIDIKDRELQITKSEHYTDDVNALTLEDILNNLFLEFPGRDNIAFIRDRS